MTPSLSLQPPFQQPTQFPEMLTPFTPLDNGRRYTSEPSTARSLEKAHPYTANPPPTLQNLPLEIRLQIYNDVLSLHPIQHAHLTPFATSASQPAGPTTAIGLLPNFLPFSSMKSTTATTTSSPSLPVETCNQNRIPTSLLLASKQVYLEARGLPWEINEWTFVNWFGSGVYAARQFIRSLAPWQRSSMRHISLTVLPRDLIAGAMNRLGGGVGSGIACGGGEWVDLCRYLSGLRTLRLRIKGDLGCRREGEEEVLGVEAGWVREGLGKLRGVRLLEVEIADCGVGREEREVWREGVEEFLNRGEGWDGKGE